MNVFFFCQSAYSDDPVVGDTQNRVLALYHHPEIKHLSVAQVRGTSITLEKELKIHTLKSPGRGRLSAFWNLLKILYTIQSQQKIDICYLYMTPTMAFYFSLLKPFFGFKIVIWFAHTKFTAWTRFNLTHCCDRWFSVDRAQTFPVPHLRLIGQGVALEEFQPTNTEKKYDLITIGRVSPAKNLELMFEAIALAKNKMKRSITLLICGDAYVEADRTYRLKLEKKLVELGLSKDVTWAGVISRQELPAFMAKSRTFIFTVPGGIGKATMEAMAMGMPMIIAYPDAHLFLGPILGPKYTCEPIAEVVAKKVEEILSLNESEYAYYSNLTTMYAKENFSLNAFTAKLVAELKLI